MTRGSSVPVALALAVMLTGCASPATVPPQAAPSTATASPSPESSVTDAPELRSDASAADNLPLFRAVTEKVWRSGDRADGRAYIDALAAAGFPADRMQVTADRSTVGNPAESIQFSVAWGDAECLIGQVGPSTGEPVTAVLPQLAEGRCLIGRTAPVGD